MRSRILLIFLAVAGTVLLNGCQRFKAQSGKSYKTLFNTGMRDYERAKAKHDLAIERICEGDLCAAEQLLRDALICDTAFGPAHNTLGKIYFDQRKFYLAAWEFEHALKLMPERAEPSNNLGLVFEAVGDYESAIQYFQTAWSQEQDNAHFLGNLLRARIRQGDQSYEVGELLRELIKIDDRTEWVDWAKGQLAFNKIDSPYDYSSGYGPIFEETPISDSASGEFGKTQGRSEEVAPKEATPQGNGSFDPAIHQGNDDPLIKEVENSGDFRVDPGRN